MSIWKENLAFRQIPAPVPDASEPAAFDAPSEPALIVGVLHVERTPTARTRRALRDRFSCLRCQAARRRKRQKIEQREPASVFRRIARRVAGRLELLWESCPRYRSSGTPSGAWLTAKYCRSDQVRSGKARGLFQ